MEGGQLGYRRKGGTRRKKELERKEEEKRERGGRRKEGKIEMKGNNRSGKETRTCGLRRCRLRG